MTQLEILKLAVIGACQKITREEELIARLTAEGKQAPIATRKRDKYIKQFCELSDMVGVEETKE